MITGNVAHYFVFTVTGATAYGRRAFREQFEGISSMQGYDVSGPTPGPAAPCST